MSQKNANIPVQDNNGGVHLEHVGDSDASSDEGGNNRDLSTSMSHGDRSNAMVFDRSLVGDRNGLKTAILKAVYDNQIHLQARKGEAFDSLAERLGQTEEFKQYHLHGRKLQKSFNKIARDIKDCIVAGNEPSRWGKEEPEFFKIARKIFDEARRAGIRAFDEKLKSKSIEDRLNEGGNEGNKLSGLSSSAAAEFLEKKKRQKRDLETAMGVVGGGGSGGSDGGQGSSSYSPNVAGIPHPSSVGFDPTIDWVRMFDEYLENKLDSIKQELANTITNRPSKIPRSELEAGILRSTEQLNQIGIKSIHDLLIQAGLSDQGRAKITENCGFQPNDDISIFLLSYTDAISKDIHPVSGIRDQFDNLSARDASALYSYIGKVTK
jgi:hypothetical protein